MPKIRCHYLDCLFLDDRYCTAAAIELNPDTGGQTYTPDEEAGAENWEDEDLDETFDTYLSIDQMDKDALELFAKSNYEQDLDKRKNVETLRAQVKGMIDQFGIVK